MSKDTLVDTTSNWRYKIFSQLLMIIVPEVNLPVIQVDSQNKP